MSKQEVLASSSFGQRVAEEEGRELSAYFVETDQWTRVFSGEVDVIYGPKGSGKSAIYSLIVDRQAELLGRGIVVVPAENPRGAPAFREIVPDPPASESEFRALWKIYFLSLIGEVLSSSSHKSARKVAGALEEAKLLPRGASLSSKLRAAWEYVRRLMDPGALEPQIKFNPVTGTPEGLSRKIILREPSATERDAGLISADNLLQLANDALRDVGQEIWLILDRLDVVFTDSPQLEANALRALFRVYLDLLPADLISLKIFLRNDIWSRIMTEPFPEASHITRMTEISWTRNSLLNLIVRRLLHNNAIVEHFKIVPEQVLSDIAKQVAVFYRMFPPKVGLGPKEPNTLDWILSRTSDGTGQSAPREVIHLLSCAREFQLKSLEIGSAEPPGDILLDRGAFKDALPAVSRARFEQTLCAEYPQYKEVLQRLSKEKTEQTPTTLAKVWDLPEEKAREMADRLSEIGFFERSGTKENTIYWVPFLYRSALSMIQGSAK
jgi:hypothetical protein